METTTNLDFGQFVALMESRGRTVLAAHDITPDGYLVLCIVAGPMPYATWTANPDGETFWGHYFRTRQEAEDDFRQRIERGY